MKTSTGPIGNIQDPKKPINIVGGGFSGLVMAYFLQKEGFKFTLFENESLGGKLQTIKTEFGLVEYAANAIYSNNDVDELIKDLNLKPIYAKSKLKKWLWRGLPASPLTFFLIVKIIPKLLKKIPNRNFSSLSIFDFFAPLLGEELAFDLLSAVFGGVYAIDSKKLSFTSVFKTPVKAQTYLQFFIEQRKLKQKKYKARSISFQGGMADLCLALRESVAGSVQRSRISKVDDVENWIICTDAHAASSILDNDASEALSKIEYTSLTTTTIFTKNRVDFLKRSFGLVIPPKFGYKTKGILANTEIFNRPLSPLNSYTFIAQGLNDHDQNFYEEVDKLISIEEKDICGTFSMKWNKAIPVYDMQREKNILKLRKLFLESDNLVLFGNYIDGISLREIVTMAKKFARSLK